MTGGATLLGGCVRVGEALGAQILMRIPRSCLLLRRTYPLLLPCSSMQTRDWSARSFTSAVVRYTVCVCLVRNAPGSELVFNDLTTLPAAVARSSSTLIGRHSKTCE